MRARSAIPEEELLHMSALDLTVEDDLEPHPRLRSQPSRPAKPETVELREALPPQRPAASSGSPCRVMPTPRPTVRSTRAQPRPHPRYHPAKRRPKPPFRESEERFRSAFDNAPYGMAITEPREPLRSGEPSLPPNPGICGGRTGRQDGLRHHLSRRPGGQPRPRATVARGRARRRWIWRSAT